METCKTRECRLSLLANGGCQKELINRAEPQEEEMKFLKENRGTENLRLFRTQTSIWFLICVTLLFTSSCVVPSPTIVVESLVTTTLAAVPRT
jgi:hypothetical protein